MEIHHPRHNSLINPGVFELYCGPMKSGKTGQLLLRLKVLDYARIYDYMLFKPAVDTRTSDVTSRMGISRECIAINEKNPEGLLERVNGSTRVVAIDEIQFFDSGIEKVIAQFVQRDINVLAAGLDLDFRGEPFGRMPNLLCMADRVYKIVGACDYKGCEEFSTRTQRLIDGKPASYHSPIIVIDGQKREKYECRCLRHHEIKDKP